MTTKKDAQFSFDECSCMEMMSQSKGQQGEGDACAKIMAPFANLQDSGGECFEMMRQMMASCCGIEHEGDSTTREA
ncbi:MAG TPA: hypothetical protein VLE70_07555 [Anaerolineae bacterium]|jgi:hypothetical protein|nr:hypothetical protein [Anaerolineae bacterium]